MSKRQLLVLLVLAPLSVSAQAFSADQHILLSEGTLRGSPRIMGLAGAWTGLAEGAEGIPRNPAAPAMRDAKFASDFSWDVGGTMHFLFPWSTKDQDWDNDGSPDQASAANRDFLGSQVLYSCPRWPRNPGLLCQSSAPLRYPQCQSYFRPSFPMTRALLG